MIVQSKFAIVGTFQEASRQARVALMFFCPPATKMNHFHDALVATVNRCEAIDRTYRRP